MSFTEDNTNSKPKKIKFSKLKYIIAFLLINVIIFFTVTSQPKFEIETVDNAKSVEIRVTKKSIFPLKSFTMRLDDEELSYSKNGNIYVATVTSNGTLEVVATNLNTMSQTMYERIDSIDNTPPTVFGQLVKKGVLSLTFEDSHSDIDYDSIYAIDGNGKRLSPTELNTDESRATFEFLTNSIKAYISDVAGNEALLEFNNSEINQTKLSTGDGVEVSDIPADEVISDSSKNGSNEESTFDVGNLNEKKPKQNDDYLYE